MSSDEHRDAGATRDVNLDATTVVRNDSFSLQGAHSDLAHPELAGLVWEAATASGDAAARESWQS